jgi:hypothetical protein
VIVLPIRGRDAEAQVARALVAAGTSAGITAGLAELSSRPWASATFSGTQVSAVVTAPRSPSLGRWIADLPEAELPMPGHVLASLALDRIEDDGETVRTSITALAIER